MRPWVDIQNGHFPFGDDVLNCLEPRPIQIITVLAIFDILFVPDARNYFLFRPLVVFLCTFGIQSRCVGNWSGKSLRVLHG